MLPLHVQPLALFMGCSIPEIPGNASPWGSPSADSQDLWDSGPGEVPDPLQPQGWPQEFPESTHGRDAHAGTVGVCSMLQWEYCSWKSSLSRDFATAWPGSPSRMLQRGWESCQRCSLSIPTFPTSIPGQTPVPDLPRPFLALTVPKEPRPRDWDVLDPPFQRLYGIRGAQGGCPEFPGFWGHCGATNPKESPWAPSQQEREEPDLLNLGSISGPF